MFSLKMIPLSGQHKEIQDLQSVLEAAPNYSLRSTGGPVLSTAAQSLFSALPPSKDYQSKFVLGFYLNEELVGCADIIRGYPDAETAMIGLLLINEKYQRNGLGLQFYEDIETLCKTWPEISRARIGVIETNAEVLPFWKKLGFKETGHRVPFEHGSVKCDNIVLEKILHSFS
jgi:GNAT superfamily N-acetyltransferase